MRDLDVSYGIQLKQTNGWYVLTHREFDTMSHAIAHMEKMIFKNPTTHYRIVEIRPLRHTEQWGSK